MKYTISIIILTIFLQSCVMTDYKKVNEEFNYITVFSDTTKAYIYRTQIVLYGNDFSGLLIIKPKGKNHRIVFINEIGMKFFDIEISEKDFTVHHIFEPMNKKILIKLLVSDFRFILMKNLNTKLIFYTQRKTNKQIIKPRKQRNLFYINSKTHLPEKAFKFSIIRKNTFLFYENYKGVIPENIKIIHKNIKFEMQMSFVE